MPRTGEPGAADEGARAERRVVGRRAAEAEGEAACVDDAFAELDWEVRFLAWGIMDVVCGRVGYCGCGRDHHRAGSGKDAGERCGGESVWVVLGLVRNTGVLAGLETR